MYDASPVYHWRLQGRLHLWRFLPNVKGLEGWHLNADAPACASMADLLDRMLSAEAKTHKRIPVSVPARMLVGQGHPWKSITEFVLCYPHGEVEEDFWQMALAAGDVLTLTLGSASLREFQESLLGLPHWKDDFALGPKASGDRRTRKDAERRFADERLWFWTKVE